MKIEKSTVQKLNITGIKHLDPISVYLEDFGIGKGKITISCYDKSWHSYWGAMGDRNITEFVLSCDNHYLGKNLSSIKSSINDYDKLAENIKEYYGEEIDYFLKSEINSMGDDHEWDLWLGNNNEIMTEVFGEEWWYYDIPTKENPEYKYFCRILDIVKDALKNR